MTQTNNDYYTIGYNSGIQDTLTKLFNQFLENCPSNQVELLERLTEYRKENVHFEYF